MHTKAADLRFADTVAYRDEFYHVVEAVPNNQGGINVELEPIRVGLTVKIGVPKQFCFFVTNRLQS